MAKGKKGGSTSMVSPMYISGNTNGQVAGPTGGERVSDPFGYLSRSGKAAPSGSMSEHGAQSKGGSK